MTDFVVRLARAGDARASAELFATVAAERDGIGLRRPVSVRAR